MAEAKKPAVVVSGVSGALGLAISQTLVKADYFVVGVGRRPGEDFLSLPDQSRQFIPFDLSHKEGIKNLASEIVSYVGSAPYGLVNNSAVGHDGVLATQHEVDISEVLTVNLEAPILLTKYLIRHMIRKREGRIVNISSIIARTGFNGLAVYGASKAGLEGFTRSLSREVGRAGITVNAVAPGFMRTAMTKGLTGSKLEAIERRAPLGLPDPIDAANAVKYFLSPEAAKITGTVLIIDGGSSA